MSLRNHVIMNFAKESENDAEFRGKQSKYAIISQKLAKMRKY